MTDVSTITGPGAAPERMRPRAELLMEVNAGAIAQEPLLDRSVVDEFIGEIGASSADSMFATFLVETERRLAVLRGLCCDDRAAIAFEAHTLTGSGGTFGMMRLSWFARELERKSATIAPGAYPAAVQQLLEVYGGARHELLAYLDTVASPRAGSEN